MSYLAGSPSFRSMKPPWDGSQGPSFTEVLARPILFGLRILLWTRWDTVRRGAISVPQIPDRSPAGVDKLSKLGKMLHLNRPDPTSLQSYCLFLNSQHPFATLIYIR
ncbi:hypothetical protein C8F04DRAFT_1231587 [Mycena alexandri]|uniref:Uncharacterized protein n=1 Tax=Mycena alexandri TaxID=1745969 RepID=A0AAD6T576_9AGAR|nr:hypothetical protein C8F04DRAFT_1231587 [Mycena alexandri]